LGVCSGGGGQRQGEGREFWQGGLGLLLFLSIPTRYDKGVDLCQDLLLGLLKNCW
jgi:hypothetical protein